MHSFFRIAGIFIIASVVCLAPAHSAPSLQKKLIVLDPGHGGYDRGAVGTENSQEKQIALIMAMQLKNSLKNRYRVRLTRTSDYWLEIPDRASLANNLKADLFISIHVAGSFQHNTTGICVNYFEPVAKSDQPLEITKIDAPSKIKQPILWRNIQTDHVYAAIKLAKLIGNRLTQALPRIDQRIQGLPLATLAGADMPAVLIEISNISNPAEETKLNDKAYISKLSTAITAALDQFFEDTP